MEKNLIPNAPKIQSNQIAPRLEKKDDHKSMIEINFEEELKQKSQKFTKNQKIYENPLFKKTEQRIEKVICHFCSRETEKTIFKYHVDSHPSQILDFLYLGNYNNALNDKELGYIKISHILNCASECENHHTDKFTYKHLRMSDIPQTQITKYFEECFEFINKAKEEGKNVFVHCFLGKSRSATIVIAYLMQHHKMTLSEAYKYVKDKRSIVFPNIGFMRQLKEFEKKIINNND